MSSLDVLHGSELIMSTQYKDELLLHNFLSPEILHGLELPVMDDSFFEEYAKFNDDGADTATTMVTSPAALYVPIRDTASHIYYKCQKYYNHPCPNLNMLN